MTSIDSEAAHAGSEHESDTRSQVPPSGYYPYAPLPVQGRTNGLAVASLVFGILPIAGIGAVLALVFGYTARKQIAQSNGEQTGRGLAAAGIVLGWVWTALLGVVFIVIAIVAALGGQQPRRYMPTVSSDTTPTTETPATKAWIPAGYVETPETPGFAYQVVKESDVVCDSSEPCWNVYVISRAGCGDDGLVVALTLRKPDGTPVSAASAVVSEAPAGQPVLLKPTALDPALDGTYGATVDAASCFPAR